jgi:hypothetical protein
LKGSALDRRNNPVEAAYERFIARVLHARVEHFDDGSVNGMVDALIYREDRAVAALEVTTVADETVMEMESFDIHIDLPESAYWWDVRYPGASLNQKELKRHLAAVVRLLDAEGLDDAIKLDVSDRSAPEIRWVRENEVRVRRWGAREGGGRAAVLPEASGSFVDERLEGLTDWVLSVQNEPWWTSNVGKLASSGYTELHLAVELHQSGVPAPLWFAFWGGAEIAAQPLTGIEPLTDLWLHGGGGGRVVHWSSQPGWESHPYNGGDDR